MIKRCLLFLSLFLLCGCSANYNLKIDDGKVLEKLKINNVDINNYRNIYIPIDYNSDDSDVFERKFDGIDYYNMDFESNSVTLSYEHNYNSFSDSYILNSCYENVDAYVEENRFILSTTGNFECFERYNNIDNVKVSINSQYELIDTNASKKNKFNYEWIINKNNIDEGIYLELDITKRNKSFEESFFNSRFTNLIVFVGVVVGCIILYLIFKFISNMKDRI